LLSEENSKKMKMAYPHKKIRVKVLILIVHVLIFRVFMLPSNFLGKNQRFEGI